VNVREKQADRLAVLLQSVQGFFDRTGFQRSKSCVFEDRHRIHADQCIIVSDERIGCKLVRHSLDTSSGCFPQRRRGRIDPS
jgi:hypothetical protein